MMQRPFSLHPALAVILLLLAPTLYAQQPVDSGRLSAFVEQGMELWHVPGMAVTVVAPNEVLYQGTFGVTAIDNGVPVTEHTLFANASTTKAMVAAGMMMLVDEGKLALDDLVVKYLPELHFKDPWLDAELTVRDLLSHRTGLPSTDFWGYVQGMPLDEQIERLAEVPLAAPLRARHIYQNTMYDLSGLIIERISGLRWDQFLSERLWQPIGMRETFGARGQIGADWAYVLPHAWLDDRLQIVAWDLPADQSDASGSAWTSIHDMGLWAQFLLRGGVTADGNRLLSETSFAELFEPQSLIALTDFYPTAQLTRPHWRSYGLGWFQQDFQGRQIDFHTGSLSGLIALIGLDRENGLAVVVLGNRDHAEMRHAVLWEIMDQAPADNRRDWNAEIFALYRENADRDAAEWAERQRQRLQNTRPSLPLAGYTGDASPIRPWVKCASSRETMASYCMPDS